MSAPESAPEIRMCGYCGEPCEGYASITIGGETRWYHHGDGGPQLFDGDASVGSCYEAAQWAMSGIRPDQTLIDNEVMREVYGDE